MGKDVADPTCPQENVGTSVKSSKNPNKTSVAHHSLGCCGSVEWTALVAAAAAVRFTPPVAVGKLSSSWRGPKSS
jgi:hypothetical protein